MEVLRYTSIVDRYYRGKRWVSSVEYPPASVIVIVVPDINWVMFNEFRLLLRVTVREHFFFYTRFPQRSEKMGFGLEFTFSSFV